MLIQGVDFNSIRESGLHIGKFYKYSLGDKIKVTTMRTKDRNRVLSSTLSLDTKKDRMLSRYTPNNFVLFDEDLVDNWELYGNMVSCLIDTEKYCIYIGKPTKYPINSGVLVLSGTLSLNQLVQEQVDILASTNYTADRVLSKVRVFSVGALGNDLVGFIYVPSERGLAFTNEDTPKGWGISAKTERLVECYNWTTYNIDDWFADCSIEVIESMDLALV